MELEKQQYLQTFLSIVRSSKSKNQFLKNVQQFDSKFTQQFQGPSFQNKASLESFSSVPHIQQLQKPKNPFINPVQQNVKRNYSPVRSNNFIPPQQSSYISPQQGSYVQPTNLLSNNQNRVNIPNSRSQQQFFKQQGSKTYHGGFAQKPYQRYQRGSFNQELNQFPQKNPNYQGQTNEGYNQYGQYNYENAQKQYGQVLKSFANFNVNQPRGFVNPNELSVNSQQNFNPISSNIDSHPNEFLANLNRDEEPDFVKYYKRLVPMPNKQEIQNHKSFLENRVNPFANQ